MSYYEEQDYTKQLDLKLWIKLFGMMKIYKKEITLIFVTMIILASCDAAFPLMSKYAIDNFITKNTMDGFPVFVLIYAALLVIQSFIIYYFILNAGRLECGVVYTMRKAGFNRLQELSFSYYDKTPVGWIMARMTSDAQRIGDVVSWSLLDLIWGVAIILIVLVCMFALNVKLALISLAVFPFLMAVSVFFQRIILKNHREVRKLNSKITGAYNEGINGARTTKTLVREDRNFEEFKILSSGMRGASCRAAIVSAVYLPVVVSLGSILVGLVLWNGGVQVQGGLIGLGTFSVFISYTLQMFEPVQQIARVFSEFQSAQAAAERTISLIETEPEIKDRPDIIEKYGDSVNPRPENWPEISGDIVFDHVGFAYSSGEQVLSDFNLRIRAGERIALVGETGAGKSTIVNLICRFYEPTAGEIRIDGVDYRERSQIWLQSNLGYVLQSPHLFSGTVADNIRYAKQDATAEEVINAAKTVRAYDFIMKLDRGFDTEVGEGGGRLSSGQKQLISFARAIIANPRIFVLDEATSSIDTETERLIQDAVEIVLNGRTSFIVAHRLSTIRSCDRILLIHGGKIVESGSHRELLRLRGAYYHLYTNQFKEEAELKVLGGVS
ncbi:MAG: ABC transporter ATP-binding protein/permease [Clostridiales bacterium]|jgi:ATP-binding cassette subfamily B protein|nr:ABC transporter ATP-binding protein/permease [Clostridiales bacterium]